MSLGTPFILGQRSGSWGTTKQCWRGFCTPVSAGFFRLCCALSSAIGQYCRWAHPMPQMESEQCLWRNLWSLLSFYFLRRLLISKTAVGSLVRLDCESACRIVRRGADFSCYCVMVFRRRWMDRMEWREPSSLSNCCVLRRSLTSETAASRHVHRLRFTGCLQSSCPFQTFCLSLYLRPFSRRSWFSFFTGSGWEPGTVFSQAKCSSCHWASNVKALKVTQNTDHNQWSGLLRSASTTGLLREEVCPVVTVPGCSDWNCVFKTGYDTIRYGRLTCAQKLTRWPA